VITAVITKLAAATLECSIVALELDSLVEDVLGERYGHLLPSVPSASPACSTGLTKSRYAIGDLVERVAVVLAIPAPFLT
jgi:hypothetical protein